MSAKAIDWTLIYNHFGMKSRDQVVVWAYELKRSFGQAARLLSEAGRSISNETVRNVLHEIGHEIYLRTNTRQIKPRSKEYRAQEYESKRSHKKKVRLENTPETWDYFCWCGKRCPWPRRYSCCEEHMEKRVNSAGIMGLEMGGNIYSNHGSHRGIV